MKCKYFHAETLNEYERCLCRGDIPSPWRDVREALPEDNDAYIVFDKEGSRGMAAYCGNGQWGGWRDVTHWIPLPAPPEGVQS